MNSNTLATDQLSSSGLLGKLPPELRNCIYELVLINEVPYGHCHVDHKTYPEQPALTRSCKLIRNEALPFFYSKNTFMIDATSQRYVEAARRWLRGLSKQIRKHIGQVYAVGSAWEQYRTRVQTGKRKQDALLDCVVLSRTEVWYGPAYELRLDGLSFGT